MYLSTRNVSLSDIWNEVKAVIKSSLDSDAGSMAYSYFFNESELVELTENEAIVTTTLEVNFLVLNGTDNINTINAAFKRVLGREIHSKVMLKNDYDNAKKVNIKYGDYDDNINEEYTFENFVVGKSNRESYSAALAVALNPGRVNFNPLFIYGGTGLGKTHLLYAIGNHIKNNNPNTRILYISSHSLVKGVSTSLKNGTIDDFKNMLYSLDVLMIDDIQFLSKKDKTNDILFDVYSELMNKRKQIILTSDCQPEQIKDVEERLISRFMKGLSVTISSPEFETAYKILEMKIKTHGIDASSIDPEVLSFLATNFSSDVRKLEGSLNRILFYSINFSLDPHIDLKLVMEAFKDQIDLNKSNKNEIEVKDIISAVAEYYGLTKQQIQGKTRTKNVANARHIAMYLCRKHLDVPYIKIGEEFGGRDHTTVLSAYDKIDKLQRNNEVYKKVIKDLEDSLFS